jgi:hypothetical protein
MRAADSTHVFHWSTPVSPTDQGAVLERTAPWLPEGVSPPLSGPCSRFLDVPERLVLKHNSIIGIEFSRIFAEQQAGTFGAVK